MCPVRWKELPVDLRKSELVKYNTVVRHVLLFFSSGTKITHSVRLSGPIPSAKLRGEPFGQSVFRILKESLSPAHLGHVFALSSEFRIATLDQTHSSLPFFTRPRG